VFGIDVEFFPILIGVLALYLVPSMIASYHKHSKATAIRILNILAGWTFLGWVAAAVWAYTENNRVE